MKFTSAKVWSFGTKPRGDFIINPYIYFILDTFPIKNSDSPSPFDYQNINLSSTSPNWRMGTATRDVKIKSNNPGPGNYNIASKLGQGPSVVIRRPNNSMNAHDNKMFSGTPYDVDPFTYNPNYKTKFTNVSYSMGKKNINLNKNENPGPGTYDRVEKSSSSPFYSMGKSTDRHGFARRNESPGPGQYYYEMNIVKDSLKSVKFGSDEKFRFIRSTTPGPGNYDHREYLGNEGRKITIRGKNSKKNSNTDLPGPGAYEPKLELFKPSTKSFKMVNPSRSRSDLRNDMPGPGHYTPSKQSLSNFSHVPKWTMANKTANSSLYGRLNKLHGDIPAPGHYDLNRSLGDGPKYSMKSRREVKYDNNTPGPGQYGHNTDGNVRDKSPSWKFPSSGRKDFLNTSVNNNNPAPGQYNLEFKKSSSSSYRFPKDARNKPIKTSDIPGPGHYHIPCSIVDIPKYMVPNSDFKEEFRYI